MGAPDPAAIAKLAEWLRYQAVSCGRLGSPLYEDLLQRAIGDLEDGGPTRALLNGHEEDSWGSALALRMMGAVNRLVLEGELPELAERFRAADGDRERTWGAFRAALEGRLGDLHSLIERPVQTNEVGRCAALLPGLLAVAAASGLPLRLLEVGASAGLNLHWDRYRYEAGGFSWGASASPLRIDFELVGEAPASREIVVAERRGCDSSPLDPCSEEDRLTLLSYVWPDQVGRVERLRAALELAQASPVRVELAGAAAWIGERLAEAAPGKATVVYHSVMIQYLREGEREAFVAAIEEAGRAASSEAPLAWLRMEPAGERADVRLTIWPGGEESHLARAGYHGTPVELLN